jgi:hypothetical protein
LLQNGNEHIKARGGGIRELIVSRMSDPVEIFGAAIVPNLTQRARIHLTSRDQITQAYSRKKDILYD